VGGGFDQAIGAEPLEDFIEVAGLELDRAVGPVRDRLGKPVAVLILLCEGEQDEELDGP